MSFFAAAFAGIAGGNLGSYCDDPYTDDVANGHICNGIEKSMKLCQSNFHGC